jgi:predicted membrane channel-forming protein YqfA (hemolysin III family)
MQSAMGISMVTFHVLVVGGYLCHWRVLITTLAMA